MILFKRFMWRWTRRGPIKLRKALYDYEMKLHLSAQIEFPFQMEFKINAMVESEFDYSLNIAAELEQKYVNEMFLSAEIKNILEGKLMLTSILERDFETLLKIKVNPIDFEKIKQIIKISKLLKKLKMISYAK